MQVKIVIPDDIYEKIKTEADKNFRTATQEINYRLYKSFLPQQNLMRGGNTHDATN